MTLARQRTATQQAQAGTAAWIPHLSIIGKHREPYVEVPG